MMYYANFVANNGTRYRSDITDTNKERIIRRISTAANANRFDGCECTWIVTNSDGDCVAAGYTLPNGIRGRIKGRDLRYYDVDNETA